MRTASLIAQCVALGWGQQLVEFWITRALDDGEMYHTVDDESIALTEWGSPASSVFIVDLRGFRAGEPVRVTGLRGRPDLNGRTGIILRCVEEQHRFEVQLDEEKKGAATYALKSENLA